MSELAMSLLLHVMAAFALAAACAALDTFVYQPIKERVQQWLRSPAA